MHIDFAQPQDQDYLARSSNAILKYHQTFDAFYKPVEDTNVSVSSREKIELVAIEAGERVGCVIGVITYDPVDRSESFALIQAVWVEEHKRMEGVAQQLVAEFEKVAQAKKVQRVELLVDVRNGAGQQLWDSQGYEVYQERRYKRLT